MKCSGTEPCTNAVYDGSYGLLFHGVSPEAPFAGASDYSRVFKLVEGLTDAESLKLRHAGYVRARKILEKHATEVEHLAKRLITHKRVTLG